MIFEYCFTSNCVLRVFGCFHYHISAEHNDRIISYDFCKPKFVMPSFVEIIVTVTSVEIGRRSSYLVDTSFGRQFGRKRVGWVNLSEPSVYL